MFYNRSPYIAIAKSAKIEIFRVSALAGQIFRITTLLIYTSAWISAKIADKILVMQVSARKEVD